MDPAANLPARSPSGARADVLTACACLLPAALLAWNGPLAPLAGVFDALETTAAGFAALAALPAAALLVWRPSTVRAFSGIVPLTALLALTVAQYAVRDLRDPLEAQRALFAPLVALALALAASRLGALGRRVLAAGAATIAVLLLLPALWSRAEGLGGILANSGELSGAAIGGALAGAGIGVGVARAPFARALALLPLGVFTLHAALAPAYAGALAALAVLGAAALVARSSPRRAAFGGLAVAVLGVVLAGALWRRSERAAPAGAEHSSVAAGDLGGVGVRAAVWRSSLALFAARPLYGVGPGQFAVAFPPYRDPREIELSSYGRSAGVETEVEHPHQDLLLAATELGIAGALAWAALLGASALALCRALRAGESARAALLLACCGVLAHALFNATSAANAGASALAGAALGAGAGRAGRSRAAALTAVGAAGLLAIGAPRAFALAAHGRAIAPLAAVPSPSAALQITCWENALAAAPRSAVALSARARLAEALEQSPASIAAAWRAVLDVRPQRVEALVQLATRRALDGDLAEARTLLERALAVDPAHPVALTNAARVAFLDGRGEDGAALLARLTGERAPPAPWFTGLAEHLLARGRHAEAVAVARAGSDTTLAADLERGERAWARRELARGADRATSADAWEVAAHLLWAREHGAAGRDDDAVRSLRQALRIARSHDPSGAPRLRLELAAALAAAGRAEEARTERAAAGASVSDLEALPPAARAALHSLE